MKDHVPFILGIGIISALSIGAAYYIVDMRRLSLILTSETMYHQTLSTLRQEKCLRQSWRAKDLMDPKLWSEEEGMRWYRECVKQ